MNKYVGSRLKNSGIFIVQNGHKTIHQSVIDLMVEIHRQVSTIKDSDVLAMSFAEQSTDESPAKRLKIETGIGTIIESIRDKRDWPW